MAVLNSQARTVVPRRQQQLPEGIAYGWFLFPSEPDAPHYVAGLERTALALIPVRDVPFLVYGEVFRDLSGAVFVFGVDDLLQYDGHIVNGYYPFGYVLSLAPAPNTVPTSTCLRCTSPHIYREYDREDGWDHVYCTTCEMFWAEPYAEVGRDAEGENPGGFR